MIVFVIGMMFIMTVPMVVPLVIMPFVRLIIGLIIGLIVGLIIGPIIGPIIGRVIIIIRVGLTITVSVASVRAVSIVVICGPMASVGIPKPEKVAADVETDAGASESMGTGAKNK